MLRCHTKRAVDRDAFVPHLVALVACAAACILIRHTILYIALCFAAQVIIALRCLCVALRFAARAQQLRGKAVGVLLVIYQRVSNQRRVPSQLVASPCRDEKRQLTSDFQTEAEPVILKAVLSSQIHRTNDARGIDSLRGVHLLCISLLQEHKETVPHWSVLCGLLARMGHAKKRSRFDVAVAHLCEGAA